MRYALLKSKAALAGRTRTDVRHSYATEIIMSLELRLDTGCVRSLLLLLRQDSLELPAPTVKDGRFNIMNDIKNDTNSIASSYPPVLFILDTVSGPSYYELFYYSLFRRYFKYSFTAVRYGYA
jgi:hypothetical protein